MVGAGIEPTSTGHEPVELNRLLPPQHKKSQKKLVLERIELSFLGSQPSVLSIKLQNPIKNYISKLRAQGIEPR